MQLYKITAVVNTPDAITHHVKWAGSEAGARAAKKELCAEHGLKANGADYETVQVGSGKQGLLQFLGDHAKLA